MKDKHLRMKRAARAVLISLLLGVAGVTKGYAYDFSAVCETGQTLYYNIIDATNHYVELTCPGTVGISGWNGYDKPSGEITFTETVQNGDVTYTLTSIGDYAFNQCTDLTGSLTIPNSVTSIGERAFYGCSSLTGDLTIPNSVTTIGNGAFHRCTGFDGSLTIPNSVTFIGENAFNRCTGFDDSLTIPNSVTTIGGYAFYMCTGFTGNLTISNSVASIGERAFYGCSSLTGDLTIPNSVTTIGGYAFYRCTGFTGNLTIPNSVTSIGEYAFCNCSGFTGSLTIPNSVTTIGNHAFRGCSGLTGDLTIPNSVTTIDNNAFTVCTGFDGSLTIPNSVTTIGWAAFSGCSGLTGDLTIPNSVTTIGWAAFKGCSGLTGDLIIPNSVTTIDNNAFEGCSSLTGDLTIPNSVTFIGKNAFSDCTGITEAILTTSPSYRYGGSSFDGTTFPIYVPYELLNAYKTATNWSSYENRIFPWLQKSISAHTETSGWNFIASPLVADTIPTVIDDMISETEANFDLYRFNQSVELEWENWKSHANNDDHYHFNLVNGQGYLYANAEDVNLIFKGTFNEDDTKTVSLTYDQGKPLAGWNLVGNPFPVEAYVNRPFYKMNDGGTGIEPVENFDTYSATTIPACTGIVVQTTAEECANETNTVTFSTTEPELSIGNKGNLQIAVAHANSTRGNAVMDKVIVSFNEGSRLSKFYFGRQNANIYIPQNGKEYAIACSNGQGEMPVNFKAHENGTYTLGINPEGVEMNYLHLIDNMTGANTDLLNNPSYSFEAKTMDYESRFRLVFAINGIEENESESFAFFSNGSLIVSNSGQATLQVMDMTGRILSSETVNGSVSKAINAAPGVYMIRLINGNDVKTQKIVVR